MDKAIQSICAIAIISEIYGEARKPDLIEAMIALQIKHTTISINSASQLAHVILTRVCWKLTVVIQCAGATRSAGGTTTQTVAAYATQAHFRSCTGFIVLLHQAISEDIVVLDWPRKVARSNTKEHYVKVPITVGRSVSSNEQWRYGGGGWRSYAWHINFGSENTIHNDLEACG